MYWVRRDIAIALAFLAASLVRAQPGACQLVQLNRAPDLRVQFGHAVACRSNVLLVGVPGIRETWGAAYVVGSRAPWRIDGILTPSDAAEGIGFGDAVYLNPNGTIALVGAPYDIVEQVIDGSVYVYESSSLGAWTSTAKLTANQSDQRENEYDYFGRALALDGETILVGAYNDRSAYVFDRGADGSWTQTARLTPGINGWYFGYAVALAGDVAVVGAPFDFTAGNYAGAAFVFERDADGAWAQTAQLLPNPGNWMDFGWSVAMTADTILVGAPHDNTRAPVAGSVYVFGRDGAGQWARTQILYAASPENSDAFGGSVAIDGELAIVGAEGYGPGLTPVGGAFTFHRGADGVWRYVSTMMAHAPQFQSWFGRTVALSGNLAIVGAPFEDAVDADGNLIENAGAAYVFAVGPDEDANGVMDICECRGQGDLTLDGSIGIDDLVVLLSAFGTDAGGDLDADGQTSLGDLAMLLSHWGATCE